MEVFLIRDIIHTLINLILNNDKDLKVKTICLQYLHKCTKEVVLKHYKVLEKYLKFIVGTMVSLCGTDIETLCLNFLHMLLIDNYDCLKMSIQQLDPLPMENKFLELKQKLETLQCLSNKTLEQELSFFVKSTNDKNVKQVHIELLRNLRLVLADNKKGMRLILEDLKTLRGFSEDCEHSLIHKLICSLLQLICSKDKTVCLESAKCLGELGPVNLTTMMLNGESCSTQTLLNTILEECLMLLIDLDIKVKDFTTQVLYDIFKSKEGFEWLKLQKQEGLVDHVLEFRPFIKNHIKKMPIHFVLSDSGFKSCVDVMHVWTPVQNCEHKEWLISLTTTILKGFSEESFLRKLIPICEAKVCIIV